MFWSSSSRGRQLTCTVVRSIWCIDEFKTLERTARSQYANSLHDRYYIYSLDTPRTSSHSFCERTNCGVTIIQHGMWYKNWEHIRSVLWGCSDDARLRSTPTGTSTLKTRERLIMISSTTGKAHNRLPENAREMAEIVLLSRGRKMSGKRYLAGSDVLPQ